MISTSYGSVLGTFVKKISQKFRFFFVQIKTFRHFKSPKMLPPFFQSNVFCILCICSGVTKVYRGEDKALEMDRKELLVCTERGKLEQLTSKKFFF
jgi:hypothetical protein